MKNMSSIKLNKDQKEKYWAICELTWGCAPVDIDWAIKTDAYKSMEEKLIANGAINKLPTIEPLNK